MNKKEARAGITPFTIKAMSQLSYELVQKLIIFIVVAGVVGHLLFYYVLKETFKYQEAFVGRLVVITLFLSLLFLARRRVWNKTERVYFDVVYGLVMPTFFTYMYFLNGGNVYWSSSIMFMSVLYGIVGHPIKVVLTYPILVGAGLLAAYYDGVYSNQTFMHLLNILFPAYFLVVLCAGIHSLMIKAFHDLKETKHALIASEKLARLTLIFEKFVPRQFLNRISPEGIQNIIFGKAHTEEFVVFFSDIRNFTSLSQKVDPQKLLNILNRYLDRMSKIIHSRGGFIDKYVGDAILALFDFDSKVVDDGVHSAISCSVEMQHALTLHSENENKLDAVQLNSGIGIHWGEVIVGTIGSEERMDSTALGDVVNVASRLEGLTKLYHSRVIVSEQIFTIAEKRSTFYLRELDIVTIRGRDSLEKIYEVLDAEPENIFEARKDSLEMYNKGLACFRNHEFEAAEAAFKKCITIDSDDYIASLYLERSTTYLITPPPQQWRGQLFFV